VTQRDCENIYGWRDYSKDEHLTRFAQRLEDPHSNWKISESDYTERALWDDYIEAFEDAIREWSTREAPWYANVKEELQDRRPILGRQGFEVADALIAHGAARLVDELVDSRDEHVLIVRPVEDRDFAPP
jgi:hypothetical protein